MQTTTEAPLFPFGQIVATPGALAALQKAGQQPGEFLARHGSGASSTSMTERKTNSASNAVSGSSVLTPQTRMTGCG
jgi:hypothetical protein